MLSARPTETTEDPHAELTFIVPRPDEKPRFLSAAITGESERFFFDVESHTVRIEDARTWRAPHLDREGFQLLKRPTLVRDLRDDELVKRVYLPEVERLIKDVLGAESVVSFDATRRSDAPDGSSNPDGVRRPAGQIHVDYTETSGPQRAADVLGVERVEAALRAGKAIVQVNAWRPIVGPVRRSPLAFADASSIRPGDLIATDQVFPERIGEIYHLRARADQRFGYFPNMTSDEVVLIKGWDSRTDGRARFTPHSAFALPNSDAAPARRSIEVRTFAIL
ncbi:MAG: CmcJ/NvfI family oxidoreductase [Myxococcota bacterium]